MEVACTRDYNDEPYYGYSWVYRPKNDAEYSDLTERTKDSKEHAQRVEFSGLVRTKGHPRGEIYGKGMKRNV